MYYGQVKTVGFKNRIGAGGTRIGWSITSVSVGRGANGCGPYEGHSRQGSGVIYYFAAFRLVQGR